MTMSFKLAISALAIGVLAFLAIPQSAYAWKTNQSGYAECNEQNKAVIQWSFTNTEPNDPKWAMDVVARDTVSGNKSDKVTVNPGETATGTIDTGSDKIDNGSVVFELTWTDGRHGVDSRTVHYNATNCRAVEVCRGGEVVRISETDVQETDGSVEECEPNTVEVCRDGEIVTVEENSVLDTDGETADCDEIEVCRDGEVVTITKGDQVSTDTDADDCGEVLPETLPNTGPGAALMSLFGIGGLGVTVRSWLSSRKQLVSSLLK